MQIGLAQGSDIQDPELLSLATPSHRAVFIFFLFCAGITVRCPICQKNKCKLLLPSFLLSLSFWLLKGSGKTYRTWEYRTIASAVIVPSEEDVGNYPPERLAKRRQSSRSLESTKRARLNHSSSIKYKDGERGELQHESVAADVRAKEIAEVKAESDDESSRPSRRPPRRAAGKDEERKRGKRLFGALLGTIGKFQQDSTSARARTSAVKRREAEAKTQERLKQQTEEIDERRKRQDQDLNLKRRMEQREFDERAVGTLFAIDWGFICLADSLEDAYPPYQHNCPGQHPHNNCSS